MLTLLTSMYLVMRTVSSRVSGNQHQQSIGCSFYHLGDGADDASLNASLKSNLTDANGHYSL